jgi:hypothetical protein
MTRRFTGIPAANAVVGYLKLLNPLARSDREHAIRLGLVAEEASKHVAGQGRFLGEVLTGELSSRLAEGVLRASGLSAWTQAGRWAFGMEMMAHVTHESGRSFTGLSAPFRRTLERYGFGAAEWDALRATPKQEHRGSKWIMPEDIADQRLRDRLMEMVLTETDYAVPVASVRTRAMFNRLQRGTWIGEIARSALLFKSFGISMVLTHGRRMMEEQGFSRLRYAAGMIVTTTLLGALAKQLKALDRGEDPAPMNDEAFWAQAMAQGGGFGIYGDFVNSATSRFDDDIYSTMAGPIASDLVALKRLGASKNRGRQLIRILKSDLPGSSLWYVKLALNRAVMDQLQMQIDPDYYDSFERMEERARKAGSGYWWRPGETTPERSPNYENALEAPPPE